MNPFLSVCEYEQGFVKPVLVHCVITVPWTTSANNPSTNAGHQEHSSSLLIKPTHLHSLLVSVKLQEGTSPHRLHPPPPVRIDENPPLDPGSD